MDRDARLKQFAGALFSHVYREYNTTFDLNVKLPHVFTHHAAADCSDEEGKAVLKLCLSMRNVFNGLFVRTFETFQRSTQHFMTFLTSRCLKLCGDDVFLSFIMICAFIAELNLFCLINGCFAFMSTAPKCLVAIFNRRLKKEFYANGGWESLRYFSEHFMQTNNGHAPEDIASEIVSPNLLATIKASLDEDSTTEESDSSSNEEDIGDIEEEECDEIEIDSADVGQADLPQGSSASGAAPAVNIADSDDSESSDETEMDSDDSEEDSDEEDSEDDVIVQPNGVKQSVDSDDEESVEGENIGKSNGLKPTVDSDDESESSEESDPSSMSEEETESEDSETDVAPTSVQTNCIKPIVHPDKKGSIT